MVEKFYGESATRARSVHIRLATAMIRGVRTFALGIYANCWLAVSMDWGLDAIPGVEEWTDEMDRRAAANNRG
jgi:hypothetical protein